MILQVRVVEHRVMLEKFEFEKWNLVRDLSNNLDGAQLNSISPMIELIDKVKQGIVWPFSVTSRLY